MDTTQKAAPVHRNHPLAVVAGLIVTLSLATAFVAGCGGGAKTESAPPAAEQAVTPETAAPTTEAAPAAVSVEAGQKSFAAKCAVCHGATGHGDGAGAAALNPKPRNLSETAYMSTRTDEQLSEIIRNGKGAMPAWAKAGMTEDEIKSLVMYIRTLAE
jgi:mono/diheme cytochrome c family protein